MTDKGPIDSRTRPRQLEPGSNRLLGYDVERDLAAHYRFSDIVFLSLTGELPGDARSRAFEIGLCFAVSCSMSAAGLVLGEEASAAVTAVNDRLAAYEAGDGGPLPEELCAVDDADRDAVAALRELLGGAFEVPVLRAGPHRDAALVAVFRRCGIMASFQLSLLLAFGRLPSAIAEASRMTPGELAKPPRRSPWKTAADK